MNSTLPTQYAHLKKNDTSTTVWTSHNANETTHPPRRLFVRDTDDSSVWWDVVTGTLCDADDVAALRAGGVECVLLDG
ncbi:hypothetical protein GC175_04960 [bacterium]|nr:hypothetical protein [bacterium]